MKIFKKSQYEKIMGVGQNNSSDLKSENERLKRLVRFMYLTLGFYGTRWNYEEGNTSYSGIMVDGGRNAKEAIELISVLGFEEAEIGNKWNGPHTCSNCGNSLKYVNMYPCKCDNPNISGLDMRSFRDRNFQAPN